jgi:hypothetical protein
MEYARYLNKDLAIYMNDVFREHMDFLENPAEGVSRRMKAAVKIYKGQGKSDEWIAERFDGMVNRQFLVSEPRLASCLSPFTNITNSETGHCDCHSSYARSPGVQKKALLRRPPCP